MTPFLSQYVNLAKTGEASEFVFLWSAISGVAAQLSRRVYLPFGDGRINPNLYVLVLGEPGTRKSTAIKLIKKRMKTIGYGAFCGDKVSMQKYLCDLAGVSEDGTEVNNPKADFELDSVTLAGLGLMPQANSADYVESFICHDEFSDFIGINNYPFVVLLGNFWDIDAPYEYRLKNSKSLCIPTPIVNILGGITPSQFNTIFPTSIADQGFLSRLIIVNAEHSGRKISRPEKNPQDLLDFVDSELLAICRLEGEAILSKAADKILDTIYKSWNGLDDPRFSTYATRRHTQLIKLSMIVAATRKTLNVEEFDIIAANTLLTYTERQMPTALGQFGKQADSDVSNKIVEVLKKSPKPMKLMEIFPVVSRDILMKDFLNLMANLTSSGMVQVDKGLYLPVKKPVQKADDAYVDWRLLDGIATDLWAT